MANREWRAQPKILLFATRHSPPSKTTQKELPQCAFSWSARSIGGYFGGRLLQAARDVTFLVRPKRAAELPRRPLIRSPSARYAEKSADCAWPTSFRKNRLVLLSCKAFDLDDAIKSSRGGRSQNAIIPLLNGMSHLAALDKKFGREAYLAAVRHRGDANEARE